MTVERWEFDEPVNVLSDDNQEVPIPLTEGEDVVIVSLNGVPVTKARRQAIGQEGKKK